MARLVLINFNVVVVVVVAAAAARYNIRSLICS
jgi:hypothetical protein